MRKRKLIAGNEGRATPAQHRRPCSDCPFRRDSLAGWLGGSTPGEYAAAAHADGRIFCHALTSWQCAGAAIYRANVAKRSRLKEALELPRDPVAVFGTRKEFLDHHESLDEDDKS